MKGLERSSILSLKTSDTLRLLYHNALLRVHKLRCELRRREIHNATETRVSKLLPTTSLSRQLSRAIVDVESARREYAPFNPADRRYVRQSSTEKQTEDEEFKSGISFDQQLFDINEFVDRLDWTPWPDSVKSVQYASVMRGIGDGEQRLACLFGGSIMGANKSYDVLIKNSGAWEVKDMTSSTEIRIGADGVRSYVEFHDRLSAILSEMHRFVVDVSHTCHRMSCREREMLTYVSDFIDANLEKMINAGEVSRTRFAELLKAITFVSCIKRRHGSNDRSHPLLTEDFFVEHVDHKTYVDIARRLMCDAVPDTIDLFDVALGCLHDEVFDDPRLFVDFVQSIRLSSVINVDVAGVVLVHRDKGFLVISRACLDSVIIFERVTQSRLKFKFVGRASDVTTTDI